MIKLKMRYLKETKTCTVFQSGTREGNDLLTLYLKKSDIAAAGIDPAKGITVAVEEDEA